MKIIISMLVIAIALTGCISFHPAGPLNPPAKFVENPLRRAAMIKDVIVSDKEMDEKERKEASKKLTVELEKYIGKAGYFENLLTFPAKLGEQDVLLKFEFTQLKSRRVTHPAYFPGALLTATLWIWFNGPIYKDSFDLAGNLAIEDSGGHVLAKSDGKIASAHNTGLFDPEYLVGVNLGNKELGTLIKQLLDDAIKQVEGGLK